MIEQDNAFVCVLYFRGFAFTKRRLVLEERCDRSLSDSFQYTERPLYVSPANFDFLGQNVRRYPNGKLLIKPSKKNVKTFLAGVRATIKAGLGGWIRNLEALASGGLQYTVEYELGSECQISGLLNIEKRAVAL